MTRLGRIAWHISLAVALVFAGVRAERVLEKVDESAFSCDSFGYLEMARETRAGDRDFRIETDQTRALIQYFQSKGTPPAEWGEFVAPHAFHYQPRIDQVRVQYPQGTGWMLSLFPEGEAVRDLNFVSLALLLLFGIAAQFFSFRAGAPIAGGFFALVTFLGMEILRSMRTASFSVNASIVPILAATFFAFFARNGSRKKSRFAFALISGAFLGFCFLIRIPSLLLVPGFLIFLSGKRDGAFAKLGAFLVGFLIFGAVPLALHQQRLTGAWYLSTYNSADTHGPALSALKSNLAFYLGSGDGSRYSWFALVSGVVLIFLFIRKKFPLDRKGVASVLAVWGLSFAYFLLHSVTAFYYLAVPIFSGGLILAFSACGQLAQQTRGHGKAVLAIFIASLAILASPASGILPPPQKPSWNAAVPDELKDSRAWIFSDVTSGSFWYYAHKAAFKAPFATSEQRREVAQWIAARGGRLYLVADSPEMEEILGEFSGRGLRLTSVGSVFGRPYYRIGKEQ